MCVRRLDIVVENTRGRAACQCVRTRPQGSRVPTHATGTQNPGTFTNILRRLARTGRLVVDRAPQQRHRRRLDETRVLVDAGVPEARAGLDDAPPRNINVAAAASRRPVCGVSARRKYSRARSASARNACFGRSTSTSTPATCAAKLARHRPRSRPFDFDTVADRDRAPRRRIAVIERTRQHSGSGPQCQIPFNHVEERSDAHGAVGGGECGHAPREGCEIVFPVERRPDRT